MSIFKKYPKNKQDDNGNEFEEVYAGPEEMESHFDEPQFTKVYAGPPKSRKGDSRAFEGVYAGPKEMNKENGEICKCVYAGPEKKDIQPEVIEVPAEPEEFDFSEEPAPNIPPYPNQFPDPNMMMCVYAGPEQMSGNYHPIGAYAQPAPDTNNKFCPNCGTPLKDSDKFCTNCGTKVKVDE